MNFVIRMLGCVISTILLSSIAYAATPPNEFLNSKIYFVNNGHIAEGGRATTNEFVSKGLKPGKWTKGDKNQWIYRVISNDAVKKQKKDVAFSFVITELEEAKGVKSVVLNRIVADGQEYNAAAIYNLFKQVYFGLPSIQAAIENEKNNYSAQEAQKMKVAMNNFKSNVMGEYLTNYKIGQAINKTSTVEKTLNIRQINDDTISFTIKTNNIISSKIQNICSIDGKLAKFTAGLKNNEVYFEANHNDDNCYIRIKLANTISIYEKNIELDVNYKGNCEKYCTYTKELNSDEFSISSSYRKLYNPFEAEQTTDTVESDGWK